jgi:hypothetical protein
MRKASTWMLEKGIHTPSPSPDLIPAGDNKTVAENSHGNWNIERAHFRILTSHSAAFSAWWDSTNISAL